MNKYVQPRPCANPEAAARKLFEIANDHEPYMDGRILIERLNGAMLYQHKAAPAEYKCGLIVRSSAAGWNCTRAVSFTLHAERQGSLRLRGTSRKTRA
jgi:hypothetical protein